MDTGVSPSCARRRPPLSSATVTAFRVDPPPPGDPPESWVPPRSG